MIFQYLHCKEFVQVAKHLVRFFLLLFSTDFYVPLIAGKLQPSGTPHLLNNLKNQRTCKPSFRSPRCIPSSDLFWFSLSFCSSPQVTICLKKEKKLLFFFNASRVSVFVFCF